MKRYTVIDNEVDMKNIVALVNEANSVLSADASMTEGTELNNALVRTSSALSACGGAVLGGIVSVAILSASGSKGLSAPGITSGLKAMGKVIGGSMVSGVFVAMVPVVAGAALLGLAAYLITNAIRNKRMHERAVSVLREALNAKMALDGMTPGQLAAPERRDYVLSVSTLLGSAIANLSSDLGIFEKKSAEPLPAAEQPAAIEEKPAEEPKPLAQGQ